MLLFTWGVTRDYTSVSGKVRNALLMHLLEFSCPKPTKRSLAKINFWSELCLPLVDSANSM